MGAACHLRGQATEGAVSGGLVGMRVMRTATVAPHGSVGSGVGNCSLVSKLDNSTFALLANCFAPASNASGDVSWCGGRTVDFPQ